MPSPRPTTDHGTILEWEDSLEVSAGGRAWFESWESDDLSNTEKATDNVGRRPVIHSTLEPAIRREPVSERRPSVFIGSSHEGLSVAQAIQVNLDRTCEVVLWNQGVYGLSQGTLETLVDKANEFDFAVLVVTPDDMTRSRGRKQQSPRDNVLLELGLFIGVLGRKRTMVVFDRSANIKLPSDLAGVTLAGYQRHQSGNLQASLGAACTQIETTIKEQRLRSARTKPMSDPVFKHLCGIACLKVYEYRDYDLFQREIYFLKDNGFLRLKPNHERVEFDERFADKNLVEVAEPTEAGWSVIKLFKKDIPKELRADKANINQSIPEDILREMMRKGD
jgi:predicted nucleotide-binding protein